jgi:hypothetical protein
MSVQYTFGSFNQHRTVLDATGPLDGRPPAARPLHCRL